MTTTELAMVAALLAAGIVAGFVIYTYVAPQLAAAPASPAA